MNRAVVPHMVSRRRWHAGRRDRHGLVRFGAFILLLSLEAALVCALAPTAVKGATELPTNSPRPTPSVASRSLVRPFLTVLPSDHAAAGRDQTSAEIQTEANTAQETADEAEGLGAGIGEGAAPGPTAIADKHGTLKQRIAWCESRGLNVVNPSSGASGFWQFLDGTFEAVTGLPSKASDYPLSVQSEAFDELYAQQGAKPWNASKGCWSK